MNIGKKHIIFGIIGVLMITIFIFFIMMFFKFFLFFGYSPKDKNNEYDAYTILFKQKINNGDMYISTSHLNESFYKAGYICDLLFVIDNAEEDIEVKINKIQIEYSFKNKKILFYDKNFKIRSTDYENFFINNNKIDKEQDDFLIPLTILSKDENSVISINYNQGYKHFKKYRKMKEKICIEFEIDNEMFKVEKEYEIYFRYKYSLFDAWMSI